MDALIFLTNLSVILLTGLFCTFIAKKLKISNVLILLLAGIFLGSVYYKGAQLVSFPAVFLTSISSLTLVMIVFDSSSRLKFKKFASLSPQTVKLSIIFLALNLIFFTIILKITIPQVSVPLALLFSALMSGTDPAAVLSMIKSSSSKVFELLKIESLINTPLTVLFPFIILDFIAQIEQELIITKFIDQILPFLQQFVAGIGAGILVGIIMLRFMKKGYSQVLSPLVMITSALIAYILAENLGGNGVLSVTAMGLLFGNIYLQQKIHMLDFSLIFANSLEILVFILIGLVVKINLSIDFLIFSFFLFIFYLILRFVAVNISLKESDFSIKEKIFMALNAQKGIAVAVVTFSLATFNIEGMEVILNLVLAFMLYSIIVSTITIKLSKFFIVEEKIDSKSITP